MLEMSKGQALRALVKERLTAAAEEIFTLFERTIAEYEEELCRSKEENLRTLQRLEAAVSPVHCPSPPGVKEETEEPEEPEEPQEPEEQGVKQEEEQLSVSVPEFSGVCVKRKESLLLQQRQTREHREDARAEDDNTASEGHTQDHYDDWEHNDDWELPLFCAAGQTETEADADCHNQVHNTSAPETSGDMCGTGHRAERRKRHQCSDCAKQFWTKQDLQRHIRVHAGERPYSCSICQKDFATKGALNVHRRRHTDKPCSCPVCNKEFTNGCNLKRHIRTHTGEKPYSCSFCSKEFNQSSNLKRHMRIHLEEQPELSTEWPRDVSFVHVPF